MFKMTTANEKKKMKALEQEILKRDARIWELKSELAMAQARTHRQLNDHEVSLVFDALDSHAYWTISEEHYRSNGYVIAPGADDPELVEYLREIDALCVRLGGGPITGAVEPAPKDKNKLFPCAAPGCNTHTYVAESFCPYHAKKYEGAKKVSTCDISSHEFEIRKGARNCRKCGATRSFPNTRDGLLGFMKETTEGMLEIAKSKNTDYAGRDGVELNPFANFTRVEALGICKAEVGFLTRMSDKLSRIASFVDAGTLAVKDESVQDTLKDLANYSLLMLAFLESKKEGK